MHLFQLIVVIAISTIFGVTESFRVFNNHQPISDLKIKNVVQWAEKTFNFDFKPKSVVFSFEDCGSDSDSVRVNSLVFDPVNPKVGDVLTMAMGGTVKELFSAEGEGTASVYFEGIEVQSTTLGVCALVQTLFPNAPCPPPRTGNFSISSSHTLSGELPEVDGRIQVLFRGTHGSKSLFCFGFNVDLTTQ